MSSSGLKSKSHEHVWYTDFRLVIWSAPETYQLQLLFYINLETVRCIFLSINQLLLLTWHPKFLEIRTPKNCFHIQWKSPSLIFPRDCRPTDFHSESSAKPELRRRLMNWSHIIPIIKSSSAICRALLEVRLRGPIGEVLTRDKTRLWQAALLHATRTDSVPVWEWIRYDS